MLNQISSFKQQPQQQSPIMLNNVPNSHHSQQVNHMLTNQPLPQIKQQQVKNFQPLSTNAIASSYNISSSNSISGHSQIQTPTTNTNNNSNNATSSLVINQINYLINLPLSKEEEDILKDYDW